MTDNQENNVVHGLKFVLELSVKKKNRKCKWTGVIIKRKSWVKKSWKKNKKILS